MGTPAYSLEDLQKLLIAARPPKPDVNAMLPPPEMPAPPDPSLIRDALNNATRVGLIHNITHTHNPTAFEFQHGATGPTQFGQDSGKLLQQAALAPAQAAAQGYDYAKEQASQRNKYAEEKAKLGVQAQLGDEKLGSAEMRGLLSGYFGTQKVQTQGQTAREVGAGHDAARLNAAHITAGDTGGDIPPDIKRAEAQRYITTGSLQTPKGLRGAAARKFVTDVMNMADELQKQPGATPSKPLAQAASDYGADKASQGALQKQSDATNALEKVAEKNLGVFLGVAKKLTDTGSPLLNQPARWLDKNAGDPNVAAFNAARQTAVGEIAKVLNASGSTMTDSLRHEVSGLIDPNATGAQIAAAANILIKDMHNRRAANEQQLGEIKNRIGGSQGKVTIREKASGKAAKFDRATADQILRDPGYEEVQ